MPLVSVIIPTFNRTTLVQEAIDSVRSQIFGDYELIVVDDGSQNGLVRASESCGKPDGYLYLRHGGVSRARNIGAKISRGTWLSFLDSDDLWLPHKLSRQIVFLQNNPEYSLCYTDEIWIRRGVRVNPLNKHQKYSGWIFRRCLPLCLISPSSVILKRSLFESMGGFDESLPVCEDYDLWLRITSRYPVAFLNEKLIVKRGGHDDQLSHSEWGMDRFRVQALQKLLNQKSLDRGQERDALTELIRKCTILIRGFQNRGKKNESTLFEMVLVDAQIRLRTLKEENPSFCTEN